MEFDAGIAGIALLAPHHVVSSNGLRSSSSFRFGDRVL